MCSRSPRRPEGRGGLEPQNPPVVTPRFRQWRSVNKCPLFTRRFPRRLPATVTTKNESPMSQKSKNSASPAAPKLAYTREEAAAQLGVCPMTVTRLTKRGLLRPSRALRRTGLYSHEELVRFLRDTASKPVA